MGHAYFTDKQYEIETTCLAQNPRMKGKEQGFIQSVGTEAMIIKDT